MMKINLLNNLQYITKPQMKNNQGVKLNALEKDTFEKSKEISFEGHECQTDDFKVKYLKNIPCACCGHKTVTNAQLNNFIDSVSNKTGNDLAKTLTEYQDYLRPVEKEVAQELIKYSFIYPDSDIKDLTQKISVQHREYLVNKQRAVIEELETKTKLLDEDRQEAYLKYLNSSSEMLDKFDSKVLFKRKSFISRINSLCDGAVSEKDYNEIINIASKMPNSLNSASAFFIKYARRGQTEIVSRLINPSLITAEHVVPKSRGGENNTGNYIAMCASCNSQRSSIPYPEWMKIHPEMAENLQKYLDEVVLRIKNHQLRGYDDYPDDVVNVIKQETNGEVELKINELIVSENFFEQIPHELTKKERLEKMQQIIEEKGRELSELRQVESYLQMDEEYHKLVKYFNALDEIKELKGEKGKAKKEVNIAKQTVDAQETRRRHKKQIETELKEGTLPAKYKEKLEEDLDKVNKRLEKDKDAEAIHAAAKEEYNKIREQYSQKAREIGEMKSLILLPEDFESMEDSLRESLKDIYSTRREVQALQASVAQANEIQKRKTKIQTEMNQLQYMNQFYNSIVEVSEREKFEVIQRYDDLIKKRDYLDSLGKDDINLLKKTPKGVRQDFIVKEARNSIQYQIEEMEQDPIVQFRILENQINDLNDEKQELNMKLEKINGNKARLEGLEKKLALLEQENTEQNLVEELEVIRKRKNDVKDKIAYLNIEDQIANLESLISKHLEEIERIASFDN